MKKLKCKKCEVVLDYPKEGEIQCNCGNLTLNAKERVIVCNHGEPSFCTIDDEGNEITNPISNLPKHELLQMLKSMRENIERLPSHAQSAAVNHYDLLALLVLLESLFEAP